jgi:hypothetical protein
LVRTENCFHFLYRHFHGSHTLTQIPVC